MTDPETGCVNHARISAKDSDTGHSTTFKSLRDAREQHVHALLLARSPDPAQRALAGATERIARFHYVGQGHVTTGDALLADAAAARAREHRRLAREERAMAGRGVSGSREGGPR